MDMVPPYWGYCACRTNYADGWGLMSKINLEDLIVGQSNHDDQPGIIEALLSTIDSIFTNSRMLQRSRLSPRQYSWCIKGCGDTIIFEGKALETV